MKALRPLLISTLAVSAMIFAFAGNSLAATRPATAKDTLVVKITSTPTVWGKVTVDYASGGTMKMLGSCSKSKCTLHPPHMAKLTLSEKPTDMSTWKFGGWSVTNGGKKSSSMKTKLKFEISGGMATVTAKYNVA